MTGVVPRPGRCAHCDTNVLVSALRSPTGALAELLRRIRTGRGTMLASVPLFAEYEAIATRPEHLAAAGADRADVGAVLDVLASCVEPVEIYYLLRPRLREPDDDMVLEAAVNGQAKAIVTCNLKDFGSAPEQFGIEIIGPGEALRRL